MNKDILFSATHDGIDYLTVTSEGGVTTRHRRHDEVVHIHRQQAPLLAEFLQDRSHGERWHAEIIQLPATLAKFFDPPRIVALRRNQGYRPIDFAIPFAACDDDQVDMLLQQIPDIMLLLHDDQISCHREKYEGYMRQQR